MSLVDPVLVRAAESLGARRFAMFREVYFPATLPHIFTGLTIGMGVAWVSLIAAEMISGQFGIGYFTWEAYSLVQYSDIALGMICIGVLGLASSALIRGVGHLAMPWSEIMSEAIREVMGAQADGRVKSGLIEIRDFNLSYETIDGTVEAVTDVDIRVEPGEFVSIIGPSGCGKSTLLNAVAGFLKPTSGTVTLRRRARIGSERGPRDGISAIFSFFLGRPCDRTSSLGSR